MKISFVALAIHPCLANDYSSKSIGGAEVQQAQIARGLATRGIEVSVITEDHGQAEAQILEGITVFKTYRAGSGLPVLRFLYPKLTSIIGALQRADADIYYVRNASFLTAVVAYHCHRNEKVWVYAGAHDTDFMPGKELISNVRDRWLFRLGLRNATHIIVQSQMQAKLLREYYGRDCKVIHNFSASPSTAIRRADSPIILWVSTIRRWKRPELLLELARRMPKHQFVMVGGPDLLDQKYYDEIENRANDIDNVNFLGFLPLNEVEALFDQVAVFVNTSEKEGFPNSFLQAWRRGIRTVTFFDPDGIVTKNGLGQHVNTITDAAAAIRELYNEDPVSAVRIRNYYDQHHSEHVLDIYRNFFLELV